MNMDFPNVKQHYDTNGSTVTVLYVLIE